MLYVKCFIIQLSSFSHKIKVKLMTEGDWNLDVATVTCNINVQLRLCYVLREN